MHNKHNQKAGRTPRRSSVREPLTDDQIKGLLVSADREWQGIILTGLDTGARLLDAASLRWSHVDLDKREIHFHVPMSPRPHLVPMHSELHGYYASLTRPTDLETPVFPTCFKCAQEGRGRLASKFRSFQSKAGLKAVGFLSLRMTFIHDMNTRGIPEQLVARLVGHWTWQNRPWPLSTISNVVAQLPCRLP